MKQPLFIILTCLITINSLYAQTVSDTIDFEAYESETPITDQYLSEGVIFSGVGAAGDPVVYDYGAAIYGRVLHSDDWYHPIKISFVDSADATIFRPARKVQFDNPVNPEIDYISVNAYDSLDVLLYHYLSTSPEHIMLDFTSNPVSYLILDDSDATAYVIDNLIVEFKDAYVDTTTTDTTTNDTTITDTTVIDTSDLIAVQFEKQFTIFPNPSNGEIHIRSEINFDAIEVRNESGQIIYALKPEENDISFWIDVPGIYFITATHGNDSATKRIIVTR